MYIKIHIKALLLLFTLVFADLSNVFSQSFERIEPQSFSNIMAKNHGVSVADYDNDNDLDIFVVAKQKDLNTNSETYSRLFRNLNNGFFEDVTVAAGLFNLYPFNDINDISFGDYDGYKFGASWGDYNNDGFPDLFLTNANWIQLFKNNGDGTFSEVTNEAGFVGQNFCNNTSALWFDYNKDGFLDIYISDYRLNSTCNEQNLFKNNGDGTFQNVTNLLNPTTNRLTYMSIPIDANNDSYPDLYLANDFSQNDLFINQNSSQFNQETTLYGLDNAGNGMGLTIGDYNNDSLFDLYLTNVNTNALFTNNGTNVFEDLAQEKGVYNAYWAWDARFSDFDLDGDQDLFVVNGFFNNKNQNIYFKNLLNEGEVRFSNNSEDVNLNALTHSMCMEVFDYDNDGDLDIYVSNVDENSFFYENRMINSNQPANLNWFKVSLEGTISNRDGLGTTLEIKTNSGSQYRHYTGAGLFSQSLQPIHFGLNDTSEILELSIHWPSGLIDTYQNLNSNTTIKAIENQEYQVLNIEPSVKTLGCTKSTACNFNPRANTDDGSCTYLQGNEIVGNTDSGFLKEERYSYSLKENSIANWSVLGGEIINGQDTNSIIVRWGVEEIGMVSVVEVDSNCSSLPVSLEVTLGIEKSDSDKSIARIWNEALLEAIRNDYARPNVHARNLFHVSTALFDTWAIYTNKAMPYLIGNTVHDYKSGFDGFTPNEDESNSIEKALSYAAYRLLKHRFSNSPGAEESLNRFDLIMSQLGYDAHDTSIDYQFGNAIALGNFIAETFIEYGFKDGSRETFDYEYSYYEPINPSLDLSVSGLSDGINEPNRWQPLTFNTFIDQSGNLITGSTPKFLGPEWGNVLPFALKEEDNLTFKRDGNNYNVYHDPGMPPQLDINSNNESSEQYKWNFSLVSLWSSHLDPADGVIWDISPSSIGNIDINVFTNDFADLPSYYKELEGGDISKGHSMNPVTGQPYMPQLVPRADYARVLAEFWADGPDSETPPGHWFTILNYVSDHPLFEKKFNGEGSVLEPLEWDIKSYFILSGAMHDSAISAWSIKGWYDYIRPISAIRYMASLGQSSDESLPNYQLGGVPLKKGFIELIEENDPLAGSNNKHVGKIKVLAWKGHDYISNSETDVAGVDWILAENWWPYQRPSFVTPPFAGYVSGHSTYSRAAAEVLTLITGDEYFPGGMGEFIAKKNEFLVFEKGPSVDVTLQWATYRDASDQTSLSRIWGGIHPPADDIPGRLIGEQIGIDAFNFATEYFIGTSASNQDIKILYPNPVIHNVIHIKNTGITSKYTLFDIKGSEIAITETYFNTLKNQTRLTLPNSLESGIYILKINNQFKKIIVK
jgi:hypothetical protein